MPLGRGTGKVRVAGAGRKLLYGFGKTGRFIFHTGAFPYNTLQYKNGQNIPFILTSIQDDA
jgi:hypothetical protein